MLIVSSEFSELLGICDRVLVLSKGHVVADLKRDDATQERVLQLSTDERVSEREQASVNGGDTENGRRVNASGDEGGHIVAEGAPHEVSDSAASRTAQYLKRVLA